MARSTRLQARLAVEKALDATREARRVAETWVNTAAARDAVKHLNTAAGELDALYWKLGEDSAYTAFEVKRLDLSDSFPQPSGNIPSPNVAHVANLAGVCKDCGNGTLNNELNPAFDVEHGWGTLVCHNCGGDHLDIL